MKPFPHTTSWQGCKVVGRSLRERGWTAKTRMKTMKITVTEELWQKHSKFFLGSTFALNKFPQWYCLTCNLKKKKKKAEDLPVTNIINILEHMSVRPSLFCPSLHCQLSNDDSNDKEEHTECEDAGGYSFFRHGSGCHRWRVSSTDSGHLPLPQSIILLWLQQQSEREERIKSLILIWCNMKVMTLDMLKMFTCPRFKQVFKP